MNIKEAYEYMFRELSSYYAKTHNNEVGDMLGGFDTSFTGKPFDAAAWTDWLNAVHKVNTNEYLSEKEALKAMLVLLKEYNDHHGFKLKNVIKYYSHKNKL
jgi:hypothetical protein